jgi:hypothetical protein
VPSSFYKKAIDYNLLKSNIEARHLQPFHHSMPLSLRNDLNVFDLDKAHVDDLSIVGLEGFTLSNEDSISIP